MKHPLASTVRLLLVLAVAAIALNLLALAVRFYIVAVVLLGFAAYRQLTRYRGSGKAYGSARASEFFDLLAAGLLSDDGLLMGDCGYIDPPNRADGLKALFSPLPAPLACKLFLAAWLSPRWAEDIPIRLPSYVHIGTFAPAGSGKGVSGVITTLMSYRGSVVVTDPKGENYLKTAAFRRRKFGHTVIRLDPFDVWKQGRGDGMNPIALLPPPDSPDFINAVHDLANALVVRTGKEENPFWNNRCEDILKCVIAFIAMKEQKPELRNLSSVRRIAANQDALLATVNIMRTMCGGLLKQLGDTLSLTPGTEEFAGVMATVQQQTSWLDGPALADCLTRTDFDPRDLRSGRVSVYFILPPHRLETLASLMRVWITCTMSTLSQGEPSEAYPVLVLADEAAHLGRLRWLETSLTLLRGYGIRVWLFFQSLGQLKEVYGEKDQVILDNLGTKQYYGLTSYESCEAVSRQIGDMTVTVVSEGDSRSHSRPTGTGGKEPQPGNASTSFSTTVSEHGRRWMAANEIQTMPRDEMLIIHENLHVIPTRKVRYYDSPLFRFGRTGRNRGLGLAGTLAASFVCLIALFLSAAMAAPPGRIPSMRSALLASGLSVPTFGRAAANAGGMNSAGSPRRSEAKAGKLDATPRGNLRHLRRMGPRRHRRNDPMPGYSGFLIPIR